MIEYRIQYDAERGDVQVRGPLQDRVLFYGILDLAKEVVVREAIERARGKVAHEPGIVTLLPRNGSPPR